ncbi:hypothetical protein JXL21_10410 [Candidatus Bathyarchaeota archaeon]|nr:hypothetical protein [Candidatus Bathyarchaeota archaeon]
MVVQFIHGIDEAGKIGDEIYFSEVSVPIYNENYLMIRNLEVFNKIILNKYDIKGFDAGNLFKFARDACDDPIIEVRLFLIGHQMQNKILSFMFRDLSKRLFSSRGELIQFFNDNNMRYIQRTLNVLNAFKRKNIYAESFIKSLAIKKIVEKMGNIYIGRYGIDVLNGDDSPRSYVQVDGGYPFSFWWYDLLTHENNGLNMGKCTIIGLTNADNHYPVVSLAGTLAGILEKFPDKRYYYPVTPLEFTLEHHEMAIHSQEHHKSLSRPVYQNRLLILGNLDPTTRSLLPYVSHLNEARSKTFEAFNINTGIENFMKDFGYGDSTNTQIIKGNLTTTQERESISFCEDRGYEIKECIDLADAFESMFTALSDEIDIGSTRRRAELQAKLTRIKSACETDLQ